MYIHDTANGVVKVGYIFVALVNFLFFNYYMAILAVS